MYGAFTKKFNSFKFKFSFNLDLKMIDLTSFLFSFVCFTSIAVGFIYLLILSASPQTRTANQRQSNVERAMPRPRVIEESSRRPQSSVTSEAPVLYYCVPVDLSGRQHQPIIRYLPANADPVYPLPTTAPPSSSTPQNQQSVQNSSKSQKVDDLPSYDEALRLP
ncbi:uncharacterized protein [Chironomus tepperi]|uniref:uncharacterized protein isoform X2 n=1 Tax=Chironomus tepperi TaxID=113505 RepID=UPI00391EF9A5